MKCLDDHHNYELDCFEDESQKQRISFIHKQPALQPADPPGTLVTVHDGTTNEQVLKMMIHRLEGLYKKFPSEETYQAIKHVRSALTALELRTLDREARGVEGKQLP